MSLAFWASDAVVIAVQSAVVALPRGDAFAILERLRSRWWALVPLASIVGAIFAIRMASGTADGLTWLALIAVPPLAAVALGASMHGGRPWLAAAVVPLFALAWADRGGLAGEGAALALSALSCVTLGVLLARVAPLPWLKLGIALMAVADVALVVATLLQPANDVLNAAAPPAGLPQLQRALFGHVTLGYGDLFIAAVLGAIVAAERGDQRRTALATLGLAALFDLLFLAVDLLPATVPVALALIGRELLRRRRGARTAAAARAVRMSP